MKTPPLPRLPKCFKFRKAKDGWRWRIRARNRKIIAESGEAYQTRAGAEHGAIVTVALILC